MGFLIVLRRSFFSIVSRAGLAALLALFVSPRPVRAGDEITLAVVVGRHSKLNNISLTDLRRVFISESLADPDGNTLVPLNHPPRTTDRVAFDRVVLRLPPDGVIRFWIDRKIRGGKGPPRTVDNAPMLRRVVDGLAGAIGYLPTGMLSNEVKVVRVDGKLPSDAGYPLHYTP